MSEFPFNGSGSDDDAGAPSRTRTFVLAGVLVAALGVGGGVLLLGGSSDSAPSAIAVTPTVRHSTATPTATPLPTPAAVPVAVRVQGRNPYKALHVAATAAAPGTAPSGSPVAPATAAPTGSATPAETYPLKLVKIDRTDPTFPLATFLVDGKSYVVVPAQRFGKDGNVVVLAYVKDKGGNLTGALVQIGAADPQPVLTGKTITVS